MDLKVPKVKRQTRFETSPTETAFDRKFAEILCPTPLAHFAIGTRAGGAAAKLSAGMEIELPDAGGDIKANLTLQRERLQCDRPA